MKLTAVAGYYKVNSTRSSNTLHTCSGPGQCSTAPIHRHYSTHWGYTCIGLCLGADCGLASFWVHSYPTCSEVVVVVLMLLLLSVVCLSSVLIYAYYWLGLCQKYLEMLELIKNVLKISWTRTTRLKLVHNSHCHSWNCVIILGWHSLVKWVLAFWLSNTKWWSWMYTIAACWRTHGPSLLVWSEGQQPLGAVLNLSDELGKLLRWLSMMTGM